MPQTSHTAELLQRERDDLHDQMVRDCEDLLKHDEAVLLAKRRLAEAEKTRQKAKKRLDDRSVEVEELEAAFLKLTGQAMAKWTPNDRSKGD